MSYKDSENKALNFMLNLDKNSKLFGGMDSTVSDIYSKKYGWIEVKDITNGARCGQFTENTLNNNIYSRQLLLNDSENNCKNFVKEHYKNKNVNYFIIIRNDNICLKTLEQFLEDYNFNLQTYKKKSGTSKVPKKDFDIILKYNKDFFIENDRIYTINKELFKTYFYINNNEYFINQKGEVRKCSKTKNLTWLVEVK